jgi:TonB family protein
VKAPTKIKNVPPVYPEVARKARVQGVVIAEATIDPSGIVTDARILRSIPLLDAAALDALMQWEFTPTVVNGVAVPVMMTATVNFVLDSTPKAIGVEGGIVGGIAGGHVQGGIVEGRGAGTGTGVGGGVGGGIGAGVGGGVGGGIGAGVSGGVAGGAPSGSAPVRVGGNIGPPTRTKYVAPVYPEDAKAAGVQGVVIVEAVVDKDGKVESTKVLRSIPMLDQAALDAVRQWEFTPTLLNGVAVPVVMTMTVNFTLQ